MLSVTALDGSQKVIDLYEIALITALGTDKTAITLEQGNTIYAAETVDVLNGRIKALLAGR